MILKVGFLVVKDTEDNSKSKLTFLLGSNYCMKVKENLEAYSETDKMNLIGKQLSCILTCTIILLIVKLILQEYLLLR